MMYVPDSQIVQDEEDVETNLRNSTTDTQAPENLQTSHVIITTTKVFFSDLLVFPF